MEFTHLPQNYMATLPSNAVPAMLVWARTRAHLSIVDVAKAEKITVEQLEEWEKGEGTPSLAKLRKLAKRYKRPLMVFYLKEPPQDFTVVQDYRHLPSTRSLEFSPPLALAIRRAQERQWWASEYLAGEGYAENQFVGLIPLSSNIASVAGDLREQLGVTISQQESCSRPSAGFKLWRTALESHGILVFQAAGVEVEEMRGCALPDRYAPVVVVNSKDAEAAKTFTLLHEFIHIVLNVPAITGAGEFSIKFDSRNKVERFCNRVAAEILVPEKDFVARVPSDWPANDEAAIKYLASTFCVSRSVIIMRLAETGFIDDTYVQSHLSLFRTRRLDGKGSVPPYKLAISRCGPAFNRIVLSAYETGAIHGGELASLLGIKLKHLSKLESALFTIP